MGMCSVQRSLHDSNFVSRCCTDGIERSQIFRDRHCENMLQHTQHGGHFCSRMAKKSKNESKKMGQHTMEEVAKRVCPAYMRTPSVSPCVIDAQNWSRWI